MTDSSAPRHVYLRQMVQGERTSLTLLASFVTTGATVLDLGTGSGALGAFLGEHRGCTVDGATINEQEAAIAAPHYRQVAVADLDQPGWENAFAGRQYDFIICADVLEHLKRPEDTLAACRKLMAPGGRLLVSIPNAGYGGLVAELLEGDFAYRDEGLLDRTHLRFFTRRSFMDFLAREGWSVEAVEPIERPLNESEFRTRFDQLPPSVTRYLLGRPDAGAYQLIFAARPGAAGAPANQKAAGTPQPVFTAQLYLADADGYREDRKLVTTGVIGRDRQQLRFVLPRVTGLAKLRFDPADRPGFLSLYRIALRAGQAVLWDWQCERDGLEPLAAASHQDMVLRAPWPAATAMVLLHGDDPAIELPVPAGALAAAAESDDAMLDVEIGWPMSGDFMALAEVVRPLEQQLALAREHTKQVRQEGEAALRDAWQRIEGVEGERRTLADRVNAQVQEIDALALQVSVLTERQERAAEERNLVARHRLALQGELAERNREYAALAQHLRWIEGSTVFRATRPLVHAKMALQRWMGKRPPAESVAPVARPQPIAPLAHEVDIVVPVYRGLADTQLCINSVLASRCQTPWRLVIVNDASPEPEVSQWLREVAAGNPRIVLLENEQNLGFVGTANRGMAHGDRNDVLLLNSDTEVANDWLDRIRAAAYSDAKVASVTPFSNNATICSYPRFCEPNELAPGWDTASLDAVFARTNAGQVVDIPTGVGFCMFVRRDCLREVGLFDTEQFGKGYGEENDFCRRAAEAGWRNLHALDTFVLHTGGVSFGASKSQREIEAVEKLRRLHPTYDRLVHEYVTADPPRLARLAVDQARLHASALPAVLAVLHDRGGGTTRHARELAERWQGRANFFALEPRPGGAVRLEWMETGSGFALEFKLPGQRDDLLQALRALGVGLVHFHHVLGHQDDLLTLGAQLGVPWDSTVHDYYAMCPHITLTDAADRYCGETGEGKCHRCLPQSAAPGGRDIDAWRAHHGDLLVQARHVLAPSRDAARRIARMWATADVRHAPHTDLEALGELPKPSPAPLAAGKPLKVAVIGALSRIKGADLLEDVAALAARQGAPVEFHLIGYAYRELRKQPRAALTVHGAYEDKDLPGLLRWVAPDVVWFPALWPETYSYTLSACLAEGLPVVAPDIGAFPERLGGRAWSWIVPWDTPAAGFLDRFLEWREQHFATGKPPSPTWFAADHQVDPVIGAWSYDTDYLRGVEPSAARAVLDAAFLEAHRPGRVSGSAGQQQRAKAALLDALVRLRSAPALRHVARAIPLRWQTQVKNWLRA